MRSRLSKIAAAAAIIIAVLAGINYFSGSIDPAGVAWGNVISHAAKVDYVHFLFVADPQHHRSMHPHEGWYSHGKMVECSWQRNTHYDDGQTRQYFDRHKTRIGDKSPSILKGRTFFSWISKGLLAEDNEQFNQQVPKIVGDDFLIYRFEPPEEDGDWIDNISITVGRNSLLPIQLKAYHKYDYETGEGIDDIEDGYTLVIFDYDVLAKPPEFFVPPTVSEPPHGIGEIVLNGEEAMVDVSGAPDFKTAVTSLYTEPSENGKESTILADVAFVLADGVTSITNEHIPLELNEARKIGMGDVDNWPDKKYRNISATLVLRPTEKKNIYLIEVSCWLDTIRAKDL
ncbi:MAG: hypothetical protein ACYSYV_10900 [Planctomycetota bacterium]